MSELMKIFEKNTEKTIGCWIWKGSVDNHGYGKIVHKGEFFKAHRLSYSLHKGGLPKWDGYNTGMCVLHKCDNPSCVNPDHLLLGTHAENMRDKTMKGRAIGAHAGERHHKARFTCDQILEIRKDIRSNQIIANQYCVSKETIRDIKNRVTWRNV